MNATLRIPSNIQYGFVEIHLELEGTPEEQAAQVRGAYYLFSNEFKESEGLPDKDFGVFVERMIGGGPNHIEDLEKLSPEQNRFMQVLKRAMNRIEYRLRKETAEVEHRVTSIK